MSIKNFKVGFLKTAIENGISEKQAIDLFKLAGGEDVSAQALEGALGAALPPAPVDPAQSIPLPGPEVPQPEVLEPQALPGNLTPEELNQLAEMVAQILKENKTQEKLPKEAAHVLTANYIAPFLGAFIEKGASAEEAILVYKAALEEEIKSEVVEDKKEVVSVVEDKKETPMIVEEIKEKVSEYDQAFIARFKEAGVSEEIAKEYLKATK